MKKFLSFSFLFISLLLTAESPIDVGDFRIIGSSEIMVDTLLSQKELSFYWKVDNKKLSFQPVFSPAQIKPPKRDKDHLSLSLTGGMLQYYSINAAYSDGFLRNLTLDSNFRRYDDNWKNSKINFAWIPQFDDLNIGFFENYRNYENKDLTTEIKHSELLIHSFRNLNKLHLNELKLKLAHSTYKQNDSTLTDIDLKAKIKMNFYPISNIIRLTYLKKRLMGNLYSEYLPSLFVDNIGLWLGVEKYGVIPSIKMDHKIQLLDRLALKISNDPQIHYYSRFQEFERNSYLSIDLTKKLRKQPININISLNNSYFAHLNLFYKCRLNMDMKNYIFEDEEYYTISTVDRWINLVGIKGSHRLKDLFFQQSFILQKSGSPISYFPELKSSTMVNLNLNKFSVSSEFIFISGKENFKEEKMKDTFSLNLYTEYNLTDKITVLLNLQNMLNDHYRKYSLHPASSFSLNAGFKMSF